MSEFLDVPGAADFFATTERHVRELVFRRAIPFTKIGRLVRFRRADLDAWVEERTVPVRAERRSIS